MSKAFAYHIFAHDGGRYRTVSAVGISGAESKALEQFFFGQTNDESYLGSLEGEPGIIWRNLNGRGALTRVKNGQIDSNGRATLRFETILFPSSQRAKASQKLDALVLSSWEFKEEGAYLDSSNNTDSGEVHPDKISDVSMAVRDGERVVRRASDFSLTDIAKITSSCGHAAEFSLCFKSLNNTAPVTVNLVSLEVPERNMNTSQRKSFQAAPRRIQNETLHGRSGGDWIALGGICAILVIQLFTLWRGVATGPVSGDLSTMQNAIQNNDEANAKDIKQNTAKELGVATETIRSDTRRALVEIVGSVSEKVAQLEKNIQSTKEAVLERIASIETSQANANKATSDQVAKLKEDVVKIDVGKFVDFKEVLNKQQLDMAALMTKTAELTAKVAELKTVLVEMGKDITKIKDSNKATSQP